jgi:predicted Zn-dependent protease
MRYATQFLRDRQTVRYVRGLGDALTAAAPVSPFEFRFYVIEDEEPNAVALPGGGVYVNTGLILAVDDVAGLAGVVAHEIAHVNERHVAELYRRGRNTSIIANVAAFLIALLSGNPNLAQIGELGVDIAAQTYMATFTREAEREADRNAISVLVGAGYDPRGMIDLFEKLEREYQETGVPTPQFLRTHPAPAERIQVARDLIHQREPLPPLRRVDSELSLVQQRIHLYIGTEPPDEEVVRDGQPQPTSQPTRP